MNIGLTIGNMAALFGAMLVLAAVPSISVLTVTARSAGAGFLHGALVTAGILVADAFFILLAIFGLVFLAETLGGMFVWIKYLGAAWLIWLGIGFWRAQSKAETIQTARDISPLSSFLAGLFLTLGDQKAIFFYLGFFPAFLDLPSMTPLDAAIVIVIATVAVGGVKLAYAWMAASAGARIGPRFGTWLNRIAGGALIAVGLFLAVGA